MPMLASAFPMRHPSQRAGARTGGPGVIDCQKLAVGRQDRRQIDRDCADNCDPYFRPDYATLPSGGPE